jgi:hypothetical protein
MISRTILAAMALASLAGCDERPRLSADVSLGAGSTAQVDSATIRMGAFGVKVSP